MAANRQTRKPGSGKPASGKPANQDAASQQTTKVTLRLDKETATRLAVESAMSGESQSAIAERLLGPYLRRWRLPSTIEQPSSSLPPSSGRDGRADESAA